MVAALLEGHSRAGAKRAVMADLNRRDALPGELAQQLAIRVRVVSRHPKGGGGEASHAVAAHAARRHEMPGVAPEIKALAPDRTGGFDRGNVAANPVVRVLVKNFIRVELEVPRFGNVITAVVEPFDPKMRSSDWGRPRKVDEAKLGLPRHPFLDGFECTVGTAAVADVDGGTDREERGDALTPAIVAAFTVANANVATDGVRRGHTFSFSTASSTISTVMARMQAPVHWDDVCGGGRR